MWLLKGNITVTEAGVTQVVFKNCAPPFTKCITKIDGKTKDDAEDLYLVIPMYNLIEHSSNYSKTTGSLWFYSKIKQLILIITLQVLIILSLSSIRLH